jgi:hypothetical protein
LLFSPSIEQPADRAPALPARAMHHRQPLAKHVDPRARYCFGTMLADDIVKMLKEDAGFRHR